METRFQLGSIAVDVRLKDIKNIHLSVHPPNGRVTIAAPRRMEMDTIRLYAISKLDWIRRQQRKLQGQDRESPREYLNRESHHVWGRRYLLKVVEREAAPRVELSPRQLKLQVRPGTDTAGRQAVLEAWRREQIKAAVPPLISRWERIMDVKVQRFFVQRMKTKWGSASHGTGSIRLNTELTKKPPQCLEYIAVHEMVHLLEPTHSKRFVALMDRFMPKWQFHRDELNRLPVRYESWEY